MFRKKQTILWIVVTLLGFCGFYDRSGGAEPDTSVRQEIEAFLAAYTKAFDDGDARAVAAFWKDDAELIDAAGDRLVGREALQKSFEAFFTAHRGARLTLEILSVKEAEPGKVAVVEMLPRIIPKPAGPWGLTRTTVVLVRSAEGWLIEGVREAAETAASYEHLKALDWLLGRWSSRGASAGDSDDAKQGAEQPAGGLVFHMQCDWAANKSFLVCTFSLHRSNMAIQGTEIIGWDPHAKKIRSWVFANTGGFSEGAWTTDGAQWMVEAARVGADGVLQNATTTLKPLDPDHISIRVSKRDKQGALEADVPAMVISRVKPPEAKPAAIPAPARDPAAARDN